MASFPLTSGPVKSLGLKVTEIQLFVLPFCAQLSVSDIVDKASMYGKSMKYVTNQPFSAHH